jgi:hypothetical protein
LSKLNYSSCITQIVCFKPRRITMAEPPAWRYQKLIKPLFDPPADHQILRGRVLTCVGDTVIEDGFIEFDAGEIVAVGEAAELGDRVASAQSTNGTILPGTASMIWPASPWTIRPKSVHTRARATC